MLHQPPTLAHALSAFVYAGTSAAALVISLRLLRPLPPPAGPQPTFIKTLVAFDFNTTPSNHDDLPTASNEHASPFLLAALEQSGHALAWLAVGILSWYFQGSSSGVRASRRRQAHTPPSFHNNALALLAAPLLALASSSLFTVWASIHHATTDSVVSLTPVIAFRAAAFIVLRFVSKPLMDLVRRNSLPVALMAALLGMTGTQWLAAVPSVSTMAGASLLLLVTGCCHFMASGITSAAGDQSPWLMAGQSLFSSLLAFNASYLARESTLFSLSAESILVFVALSAVIIVTRVFTFPASTIPSPSAEVLSCAVSLAAAWLAGFRDHASIQVKAGCLIVLLLASLIRWSSQSPQPELTDSTEYSGLPTSSPRTPRTRHVKLKADDDADDADIDAGESSMHLGDPIPRLGAQGPSFPTFIYRLALLAVGVAGLVTLIRPPTHYRTSLPALPLADPLSSTSVDLPIIVATLHVDPSLPTPTVAQHKSARPFAVNATILDSDADGREQWSAPIAPLSTWPRRKWDPSLNSTASLTLSDVQFGVSGNARAFDRIALASQTWGRNTAVQWTVFWTEADDPNGMHGDHSYLLDGFKALTGRYPVVMRGDPAHPDRTMNRKWFKMLSFLYERSPKETKWFVLGDDDTVWFPRMLLASLETLPVDPLKQSLYLGDLSEARKAVNTFGKTMAFGGGGVVISRALASRIHLRHRWCLDALPDHHGDGLLRTCVEKVTAMDGQGNVTLTRMPVFNQIDLNPWLRDGRLYLTSRFSRAAPASLHHPESLPSLMADSPNKLLALYNLWHILARVPVELMFRRFFIHIESRGTAVVTFGLHVRIYMRRLPSLDHAVDYDSNISRDKEFLGVEYLLEEKLDEPEDKSAWPKKNEDYQDFWISEFDAKSNRMVFMDKKNKMSMVLTCKGPGSSLLTMCSEEQDVE